MKKRILSIVLGVGMLVSCSLVGGCSTGGGGGEVAGKTNIKVATYNGGVGMEWLEAAAKRFEEKYAEKSFEEGKTGVAVQIQESRTGDMLVNTSLDKDVYLTESVDYFEFQKSGKIADISDVVKASLDFYGESGTIEGKLDGAMKDFLTAKDGKYYALPFYDGIYGLIYDVDMFALKGWFFDENGAFTKTNKSTGIDGIPNTYDDGLPKTYAQFAQLVEKIRQDNVTPFVYSTESMTYFVNFLANYWADYEGKDKMQINWSLSGTTDILSFDGDVPNISSLVINESNYTELQKQPGKYYALKFLKEVLMSTGQNYKSATDFKAAQLQLIRSCLSEKVQTNPVAMIVDGAWFENEAELSGTFGLAANADPSYAGGDYKAQRKLAFMPIPMADDSEATLNAGSKTADGKHKQTLLSSNDSFCFVNAGTRGAKLEVAKEFVKFLHTDAELGAFMAKTSITRPFTYTVSNDVKNSMTHFGKTLLEIKESSNIVYPYSNNSYYVANSSSFRLGQWAWRGHVSGDLVSNPFDYFRTSSNSSKTAKDYFEGLGKK